MTVPPDESAIRKPPLRRQLLGISLSNRPQTRPGERRGRRRRGEAVDGLRFHDFDAGPVRIKEIDLALAVHAGADGDVARVLFPCGALLEIFHGRVHAGYFQAEMMLEAALIRKRLVTLVIEHE